MRVTKNTARASNAQIHHLSAIQSHDPLKILTDQIIDRCNQATAPLVDYIESVSPGNVFGLGKDEHMKEMEQAALSVALSAGFNEQVAQLIRILFRIHDVGRHVEALHTLHNDNPNFEIPIEYQGYSNSYHQVLSVEFIKRYNLLEGLPDEDQKVIEQAVFYHAGRTVDLAEDSLGYKLCYLLRDYDKIDIFEDPCYLKDPRLILGQLHQHYLTHHVDCQIWVAEKDKETFLDCYKDIADQVLGAVSSGDAKSFKIITNPQQHPEIVQAIIKVLSGENLQNNDKPISDHWLIEFKSCSERDETLPRIHLESYSAYMLNQLSMLFDIKNTSLIQKILDMRLLDDRLHYIRQTCGDTVCDSIVHTLNSYFKKRGIKSVLT